MKPLKIFAIGVGGQGLLAFSKVVAEAALRSGIPVVMGEVHGMAMRGGTVETTILLGDAASPQIADGDADVLLGFEPAETLRAFRKASGRTTIVTNLQPIVPPSVSMGYSSYPAIELIVSKLQQLGQRLIAIDATELAIRAGSARATNMAILGALAASGQLPITADQLQQVIRDSFAQRPAELSLAAFAAGFAEAQRILSCRMTIAV